MPSQASTLYKLFVRPCDLAHHGIYRSHDFACTHHSTLQHLPFRCLAPLSFSSQMRHGGITLTTRVYGSLHSTHSNSNKLVRAPRPLWQTLASRQESNGTASPSFVSSPQFTHSAISPQVQTSPTRIVTGDVMSATLPEAATQLSFAEFLERCNLLRAPLPRRQPNPTLFLDAAAQTFPRCAASADASTQLPLAEFFLGCIYPEDPLDRSVPPPAHGNASSASLPQPTDTGHSSTSRTSDRHVCTTAPRARLHSAVSRMMPT